MLVQRGRGRGRGREAGVRGGARALDLQHYSVRYKANVKTPRGSYLSVLVATKHFSRYLQKFKFNKVFCKFQLNYLT